MNQNVIPVFFTIDDGYAPYLDCAVRSMIENSSKEYKYKIIVLYQNVTEENMEKIKMGVKPPFEITFVRMEEELKEITDREENRLRGDYFTMTIYFRLFIADMFPAYEKGIYIDSDVIIPGDISKLFQMELDGNIIAACPDISVDGIDVLARYMEYAVGVRQAEYINSGVLLMNLKKMRELSFCRHFLQLLETYHFDCIAPDQDYINAMCNGKIMYLDACWDAMPPEGKSEKLLKHPNIIHYNLFQKPWCYDNVPYEEFFWKYAGMSPFYSDILQVKKSYSEAQKQSDKKCMEKMLAKAAVLDRQDITFRKMQESGVPIRI